MSRTDGAAAAMDPLGHAVQGPETGESVLLLNGGMMSYPAWEPISGRLAERFRVIGCDFRGQLLSPGSGTAAPPTFGGHVEDVVDLLDRIDAPPLHVLGTSFGGAVGLLLAARHPELVRSLALVTATDRVDEVLREGTAELRAAVAQVLSGGGTDRFLELVVSEVYSGAFRRQHATALAGRRERFDRLPRSWFEGLDGVLATLEQEADLVELEGAPERVACPTLVVLAGDDRVIANERSRALAAAIPGARLLEHPTSGHALVAEDPDWLTDVYLEFLDSLDSPDSPEPDSLEASR